MKGTMTAALVVLGCAQPQQTTFPKYEAALRQGPVALYADPVSQRDRGITSADGVAKATKRTFDQFKNKVTIESPPFNESSSGIAPEGFKLNLVFTRDAGNAAEVFAMPVLTWNRSGWNSFTAAYLLGGTQRQAVRTSFKPSCSGRAYGGCTYYETSIVVFEEADLRSGTDAGLQVQLSGSGTLVLALPADLLAGFLRRVDEERRNPQKPAGPGGL